MHNLPFNLSQDSFNLIVLASGMFLAFLVVLFKRNKTTYKYTKYERETYNYDFDDFKTNTNKKNRYYYHFYRDNENNKQKTNNKQNNGEYQYKSYNDYSYSYNNSWGNDGDSNDSYNYSNNYKANDNNNTNNKRQTYKSNFDSTDPFEILGCYRDDDFQTIKKQYFKLIKEFHPDKIRALGLNEDFVAFATYRTQIINKAFEQIKKYYT